jgi:hypothetical protein
MRGKRTGDRRRVPQPSARPEQRPLLGMPDWVVINGGYTMGCLLWPAMAIVAVRGASQAIGALVRRLGRRKTG